MRMLLLPFSVVQRLDSRFQTKLMSLLSNLQGFKSEKHTVFEWLCSVVFYTYMLNIPYLVCSVCPQICVACQTPIEPEAQRVSYGESHWHAEPKCFQCSGCSKCLIGQRFMAMKNMLICSVECKKILQKTNPPTNVVIWNEGMDTVYLTRRGGLSACSTECLIRILYLYLTSSCLY